MTSGDPNRVGMVSVGLDQGDYHPSVMRAYQDPHPSNGPMFFCTLSVKFLADNPHAIYICNETCSRLSLLFDPFDLYLRSKQIYQASIGLGPGNPMIDYYWNAFRSLYVESVCAIMSVQARFFSPNSNDWHAEEHLHTLLDKSFVGRSDTISEHFIEARRDLFSYDWVDQLSQDFNIMLPSSTECKVDHTVDRFLRHVSVGFRNTTLYSEISRFWKDSPTVFQSYLRTMTDYSDDAVLQYSPYKVTSRLLSFLLSVIPPDHNTIDVCKLSDLISAVEDLDAMSGVEKLRQISLVVYDLACLYAGMCTLADLKTNPDFILKNGTLHQLETIPTRLSKILPVLYRHMEIFDDGPVARVADGA